MAKKTTKPGAQGNTTVSYPFCRWEEYRNPSAWQAPLYESLLQANAKARLTERDAEYRFRETGKYEFSEADQRIRQRYNREFCLQGRANRCPSGKGIA